MFYFSMSLPGSKGFFYVHKRSTKLFILIHLAPCGVFKCAKAIFFFVQNLAPLLSSIFFFIFVICTIFKCSLFENLKQIRNRFSLLIIPSFGIDNKQSINVLIPTAKPSITKQLAHL